MTKQNLLSGERQLLSLGKTHPNGAKISAALGLAGGSMVTEPVITDGRLTTSLPFQKVVPITYQT